MVKKEEDSSISEMRAAVQELKDAVTFVRDHRGVWRMPEPSIALPAEAAGWNFTTFEKYVTQQFNALSLQLRERYEAQQTGVTAALAAAEKAVNAALIAAEKAVDKAERAQELRNQVANEFRASLQDLSGTMMTAKEGNTAMDGLRRELGTSIDGIDKKISSLALARTQATDALKDSLEKRINILETGYANIQGRIWAVSALFSIVALAISVGARFLK